MCSREVWAWRVVPATLWLLSLVTYADAMELGGSLQVQTLDLDELSLLERLPARIKLQSDKGRYCRIEPKQTLQCDQESAEGGDTLGVVQYEDNKIALQSETTGNFCTDLGDKLSCNASVVNQNEKFVVTLRAESQVNFQGAKNDAWCSNNDDGVVQCNKSSAALAANFSFSNITTPTTAPTPQPTNQPTQAPTAAPHRYDPQIHKEALSTEMEQFTKGIQIADAQRYQIMSACMRRSNQEEAQILQRTLDAFVRGQKTKSLPSSYTELQNEIIEAVQHLIQLAHSSQVFTGYDDHLVTEPAPEFNVEYEDPERRTRELLSVSAADSCQGRYVTFLMGIRDYLNIAKLQVYGPTDQLIQPVSASMSNEHSGAPAKNCIEDNMNICHTARPGFDWLTVDLGDEYFIKKVVVVNRPDCCQSRANKATIVISGDPERKDIRFTSAPWTKDFHTPFEVVRNHCTAAPTTSPTMAPTAESLHPDHLKWVNERSAKSKEKSSKAEENMKALHMRLEMLESRRKAPIKEANFKAEKTVAMKRAKLAGLNRANDYFKSMCAPGSKTFDLDKVRSELSKVTLPPAAAAAALHKASIIRSISSILTQLSKIDLLNNAHGMYAMKKLGVEILKIGESIKSGVGELPKIPKIN